MKYFTIYRLPLLLIGFLMVGHLAFSQEKVRREYREEKHGYKEKKDEGHEPRHEGREEKEEYDGPEKAAQIEFDKTKDPATGTVPRERLIRAIERAKQSRARSFIFNNYYSRSASSSMKWVERGPYSDDVGPDNPNTRANAGRTSGRIRCIMVDSSDASHKTVWVGGVAGGLWKTTDITSSGAVWTVVNDYLSNLAVTDICQDPSVSSGDVMYCCTGEAYYNVDAVKGLGVFKSTDHGKTWSQLSSTSSYGYCTRILCDYQGNVYLATRSNGLLRSVNGGSTWTTITPSGSSSNICDLEISSTSGAARLHVVSGIFSTQSYRYTDIPATVTTTGWTSPVTAFPSFSQRAEINCVGNLLYACPVNASYEVPVIYRSRDGGANWYATAAQPTAGWASGQGWYSLAVGINPGDTSQVIVGGLNCYKTSNSGSSWSKISSWYGTTGQYVHADIHDIIWIDGGSKMIVASDGGIFFSSDRGVTFRDRNTGLRLKQFYSCAIHPNTPDYFLAGAQDNGVHQISSGGLASSLEVSGGDGCFVAIDRNQPQYQFGSYIYNSYSRSLDGGASWDYFDFYVGNATTNGDFGSFINPFDYDDSANIFYSTAGNEEFFRWTDPQTATPGTYYSESFPSTMRIVTGITAFNGGKITALRASPYTLHRVYFGAGGRIVRINRADTVTTTAGAAAVNISSTSMGGTVSCINLGTSDQYLIASYSNYGVSNVWVTVNGGGSWTAVDGNLPDMPVRWCMFYPGDNTKAIIATETGIWETSLLNGSSTVWTSNPYFPCTRTDMIDYSPVTKTFAAATHGRGLYSASICETPPSSPSVSDYILCTMSGDSVTLMATVGANETVDWYDASVGGHIQLSGNTSFTTPFLTSDVTYYAETRNLITGCVSTDRTPVTVTIRILTSPLPPVTADALPNTVCSGTSTQLNASSSNAAYSYVWSEGNATGNQITVSTLSNSVYTVYATDTLASSEFYQCRTSDTVSVFVKDLPLAPVITPSVASVCNGQVQPLSATSTDNYIFNFGTAANVNSISTSSSGYPAPYNLYYGGQRMQILIKASELTAAGFSAGSQIVSLQFPVVFMGSSWGGTVTALQNFQVKIGHTSLTTLTAFQSGLTTVCAAGNFTPQLGYNNVHTFSTPFTWNGTGNLIIETTFSNNITGTTGMAVTHYNSPANFTNCIVYRADNVTSVAAASATTVNFTYSIRPDLKLNGTAVNPVTWSPLGGLYTNSSATVAYAGSQSSSLFAKPSGSGSFSYVAASTRTNGCISKDTVVLTASSQINVPLAGDGSRCGSGRVTITATPSAGESIDWYSLPSGGSVLGGGTGTTSFLTPVLDSSGTYYAGARNLITGCISDSRTAVNAVILPLPSKPSITADSDPWLCTGQSLSLSSSQASQYLWNTGAVTRNIQVSDSGSYVVTISQSGCSNSSDTFKVQKAYCNSLLNVKLFIEGYYRVGGMLVPALYNSGIGNDLTLADTIVVELRSGQAPYDPVDSYTGLLHTDGTINAAFGKQIKEGNYYIVIRHRNAIETWSASALPAADSMYYDFTDAVTKAYGNNLANMGSGKFAIYSGDLNQDGVIETSDYAIMENDILAILFGYYVTDLTGDGVVETDDYALMENNILKIIILARP